MWATSCFAVDFDFDVSVLAEVDTALMQSIQTQKRWWRSPQAGLLTARMPYKDFGIDLRDCWAGLEDLENRDVCDNRSIADLAQARSRLHVIVYHALYTVLY